MTTKKTAIDWLYSQITFNGLDDPNGQVFEQAKAMEKEQIMKAYMVCEDSGTLEESEVYADKYYNETYGK